MAVSEMESVEESKKGLGGRIVKVVFASSFLFFIFAAGLAAYFLFGGKNQVSCENVNITMKGPMSTASGEKFSLDIAMLNNNPVPMRNTALEVIFPDGTRNAEYSSISMPLLKEEIGTIEVDERVRTTINALLFGQEQSEHEITAIVTYAIDDSNASFSCEKKQRVYITTAPINLTVQALEEISSGQEVEFVIEITSNSEEVVPDLRLVADYPFGFEFISSEPEPTVGDNVWELGDVTQGMVRTLKMRGTVVGQGVEARNVGFSVGARDAVNDDKLSTILQKIEHPLLVTRPFLALNLTLDKSSLPQFVATLGQQIDGVLTFKNVLSYALHDLEIDGVFEGAMLNPRSVNANEGFYRSIDNTITWTPQTIEKFRALEPGEEGKLNFTFNTSFFDSGTSASNPVMGIEFNVRARRISDNIPVLQNLMGQSKRTLLFNSDLTLDAYALHTLGEFINTGPHPPRVDQQTTYTIVWNVKNTTNNVSSAVVRGELPVNINWIGSYLPADESVIFNPVTREVTWSIGDILRNTGHDSPAKEMQFQVSIIPSVTQLGNDVNLVVNSTLQSVDSFTKKMLKQEVFEINTNLKRDPYFTKVRGAVRE